MTRKARILIALLLVATAAGIYAYREYTRKVKDLSEVKTDLSIQATDLIKAFEQNDSLANKQYLDKIIDVKGYVKAVEKDEQNYYNIVLGDTAAETSVRCSMDSTYNAEAATVSKGSIITIKGSCTGFDANELLGSDVKLIRCIIKKEK
jgi:tRNA_anti-like